MLLESILGPLWVWLVLQEVPKNGTLIGGAIIIMTLVINSSLAYRQRSAVRSVAK
jgi:drug/metabolite transporter (DMT)-like permease